MMSKLKDMVMTVVDYTVATVALIVFCVWLFGVFIIDYSKVPQ